MGNATFDPRPWITCGRVFRGSRAIIMKALKNKCMSPRRQPQWLFRGRVAAASVTLLVVGVSSASAQLAVGL